jgi:hypothetical protein
MALKTTLFDAADYLSTREGVAVSAASRRIDLFTRTLLLIIVRD